MKIKAYPSILSGHITVPGSKSHTIRALILSSMAEGVSKIKNPLASNDCLSTLNAINQIGAFSEKIPSENVWKITGAGKNLHLPDDVVNVGNSGSLMYFLSPILATMNGWCVFTGDESIRTRPVNHLVEALKCVGAQAFCINEKGTPPFIFKGPFNIEKILKTDGKLSQYISGFMMAATRMNGKMNFELTDPKETPYLTMTKIWLEKFGVNVEISKDFKNICVSGPVQIKGFDVSIPSDWEAVAFPLEAALISKSKIVIDNVDSSGTQGDDKIVEILQKVGADIVWNKEKCTLTVNGGKMLSTKNLLNQTLNVNISAFPDAICALSAIATCIEGKTVITDIEICRKKETDRIKAMTSELSKLGAKIYEKDDSLIIEGHSPYLSDGSENPEFMLHGAKVESFKDHRIAMSLSCLSMALKKDEHIEINDAECSSVSFPDFFEKMSELGCKFLKVE